MFRTNLGHWRRRGQRPRPPRARLHLELLESRCVLSDLHLTALVGVSGTSPFLGNPVEANDPPGTTNLELEPYVAVDPTDSKHLIGAWIQDAYRGIVAGVSFNGGNSWQSVVIPGISLCSGGIYPASYDPWVSFASNGDVYLSSLDAAPNTNPNAILVSKSTDGGLTWDAPTTIVTGTTDFNDKESITADPTNSQFAYVTWTRNVNWTGNGITKGTTMFSRTTDGGKTWEPARTIFDPGPQNYSQGMQVMVLPDGTLVNFFTQILFKNKAGGLYHYDHRLSLIRSSDHGETWLPADTPISVADIQPLNDTETIPGDRGVPNPDGGLGIQALNWVFDVAMDPANGNLYAVWQDTRFSNGQYTSIAFSMSTDGGFTWSAPIRVNQTPNSIPAGNRQAFLPSVAVNEDGVVAVTYYDFRNNTPDPGLPTDVWMVHAHPSDGLTNPASWSSENRLTTTSFDMEVPAPAPDGYFVGDYEGLVAEGRNFGAFWAMPPIGGGINDQASIFFRDPLPADAVVTASTFRRFPVKQSPAPTVSLDPTLILSSTAGPPPAMATAGTAVPSWAIAAQGAAEVVLSAVVPQAPAAPSLLDALDRVFAAASPAQVNESSLYDATLGTL